MVEAGVGDQSGGDRTDQTDQPPLVTGPGHFTQQLAQGSTSSSPTAGANLHQVVWGLTWVYRRPYQGVDGFAWCNQVKLSIEPTSEAAFQHQQHGDWCFLEFGILSSKTQSDSGFQSMAAKTVHLFCWTLCDHRKFPSCSIEESFLSVVLLIVLLSKRHF